MDRFLALNPKELRFNFEIGKEAVATVTLCNLMRKMPIACRVSTTAPNRYCVRPDIAVVEPLGVVSVEVTMLAHQSLPATFPVSSDEVSVRSIVLHTRKCTLKDLKTWFALKRTNIISDASLQIIYTGSLILRYLANSSGSLESVNEVIRDTDVNEVDTLDRSALYMATVQGNHQIVRRLVEVGADVNMRSNMGETVLLEAASKGYVDIVKTLLKAGADPGARDCRGWTPLHAAASRNHVEIARVLLLDSRAEKDASDDRGKTPLHYASQEGHAKLVKLLIENGGEKDVHCTQSSWTPLHYSAANGHLRAVHVLVELGAHMDARDAKGRTPCALALQNGHHRVVDVLGLQRVLRKAAWAGDVEKVEKCLVMGASLKHKDQHGWSVLHVASFRGQVAVVELMLRTRHVQLEAQDHEGYTALHCAVEMGHHDVVTTLLEAGADMNVGAGTSGHVTPLYLAVHMDHRGIVELLEMERIARAQVHPLAIMGTQNMVG